MTKGLFPPAPVGNAPSQFGKGTRTNCRRMKMKKGIISLRTQAFFFFFFFFIVSSSSASLLSQRYSFCKLIIRLIR
jgi:hypothetical protein